MWNLSDIRSKVSDRLGEDSIAFWSDDDRESYINEAQRFVASLTRGVTSAVTSTVNASAPTIAMPNKLLNSSATMAEIVDGRVLPVITIERANMIAPNWRTLTGRPMWVVLDLPTSTARVTPVPTADTSIKMTVSIFPSDLVSDSDELFDGVDTMEQYQSVVLNMAVAYALLKERYDGDAERFYQFAVQELGQLGVNPQDIPPFRQVVAANG